MFPGFPCAHNPLLTYCEVAKFYKSSDTFTCISSPSVHLPSERINDDFCDCPDGSDEPGTSACAHLSPLSPYTVGSTPTGDVNTTLALPGYYCKNKGHQPSYVPFTNVNDGVCDYQLCCDGSDEWAKVGGMKCEDKCKEIGKEWRKKDEQRQKSQSNAAKRRKELVAEAAKLRQEVEAKVLTLQTLIQSEELKVNGLEAALAEAERQERGRVVRKPGTGGKLSILAQLAKDRIEELRESLVEVRSQRDMGKARIAELEAILTTFKKEYNPNFNDEGVKRAVRSWEDYAARDKPAVGDDAKDRDLDEIAKPDSETGAIKWSEWDESEEGDVDVRKSTLTVASTRNLSLTLRSIQDRSLSPGPGPRLDRPKASRSTQLPHRERRPSSKYGNRLVQRS